MAGFQQFNPIFGRAPKCISVFLVVNQVHLQVLVWHYLQLILHFAWAKWKVVYSAYSHQLQLQMTAHVQLHVCLPLVLPQHLPICQLSLQLIVQTIWCLFLQGLNVLVNVTTSLKLFLVMLILLVSVYKIAENASTVLPCV